MDNLENLLVINLNINQNNKNSNFPDKIEDQWDSCDEEIESIYQSNNKVNSLDRPVCDKKRPSLDLKKMRNNTFKNKLKSIKKKQKKKNAYKNCLSSFVSKNSKNFYINKIL
ncbi:unnamed protein product [Brachionus calyciflorus]|uniref:Uncharacterized protein n=1 Tax=Brachionus calyciflorus TaxID=104777 RepID=A0A813R5Y5_9BILA|nr:unnamed protein product [Brachionus calyciflorus]